MSLREDAADEMQEQLNYLKQEQLALEDMISQVGDSEPERTDLDNQLEQLLATIGDVEANLQEVSS
jgi:hypothetical protein